MIGVGIDTVDIQRFEHWHSFSDATLLRIFSTQEIAYCKSVPAKSSERLAARFAAREAFFKAVCSLGITKLTFLQVCRHVSVGHLPNGAPFLRLSDHLKEAFPFLLTYTITTSLTHASCQATAIVILTHNSMILPISYP